MKPLIDADILLYEAGFGAQTRWDGEGSPPFEFASEKLDRSVQFICETVGATEPPTLYLTGKGNFRHDVAKRSDYKKRPSNRPFHYYNLKAYVKGAYDVRIQDGLEADDLLAIDQTSRLSLRDTVICSRDKDLRQVRGFHYGWESGKQPSFPLRDVTGYGEIHLKSTKTAKKLQGWGSKFMLCQFLMGDYVDTIPGLRQTADVRSYTTIMQSTCYEQGLELVLEKYREVFESEAEDALTEVAQQVFLIRELNEDLSPKMWSFDWRDDA
jgi:hypothetical protein